MKLEDKFLKLGYFLKKYLKICVEYLCYFLKKYFYLNKLKKMILQNI